MRPSGHGVGRTGQSYQAWHDAFDEIGCDEIAVELPGDLEVPELATKDELEQQWQGTLPG